MHIIGKIGVIFLWMQKPEPPKKKEDEKFSVSSKIKHWWEELWFIEWLENAKRDYHGKPPK